MHHKLSSAFAGQQPNKEETKRPGIK